MLEKHEVQPYIDQLDSLKESLMDLSSSILREAIEKGEKKPPLEDKKVNQSIRALEKAKHCLELATEV